MLPDVSPHDWISALDRLVEETLARAAVIEPPVDAFAVAATLGMTIATDAAQRERARFVRLRGAAGRAPHAAATSRVEADFVPPADFMSPAEGRPAIVLRPEPRCERRQWAVAHEIGEHLAHRLLAALGANGNEAPALREWAANRFASRLLLPACWFAAAAAECDWDLSKLKQRFATASHELLARRMLEEPAPIVITVCDGGQITFRAASASGNIPPMSRIERTCWQLARAGKQASLRGPDGWRVRGWPIHEPAWRREILRSELPDEARDDWP